MITQNFFTSSANLYAPLQPVGQKPIGQEDSSSRIATTKPVEQLSSSGRQQLRTREKNLAQDEDESSSRRNNDSTSNNSREQASSANSSEDARAQNEKLAEERRPKQELQQQQEEIQQLSSRDREVRAHERAHTAVGGQYAGSPSYEYERGPDGVNYAISGEVPIDVGKEATPQETIQKAQVVRRAALAPAEPSPQDRSVAAQATRLESDAQRELAVERRTEAEQAREARQAENAEQDDAPDGIADDNAQTPNAVASSAPNFTASSGNEVSSRSLNSSDNANIPRVLSYTATRLQQSIASASLNSPQAGSILNQIA